MLETAHSLPSPGVDALTGLPDRASFLAGLREQAALGRPLAVLFLDLDDFNLINDGFGHDTGRAARHGRPAPWAA